jgi:hypothetical protein
VLGVQLFKHVYKSRQSLLFEKLLYMLARCVVDGWNVVYAMAKCIDIHHASTRHQGHIVVREELIE